MVMSFLKGVAGESTVKEMVGEVGDIIESAGGKADSLVSNLPKLTTRLIMAGMVIFIGCLALRFGKRLIASIVRARGARVQKTAHQMSTIKSLSTSIYSYVMYFVIVTVVLSLFGINVRSILAVAGIGSIAIVFGAQTLVKDIISGMFIWSEGSIAVGDIVDINGLQGEVESIAIRSTVIRNFNGNVYVIPNGDIRTLTNMSRGFKRAIVDVRCPYEANQTQIVHILEEEMELAGNEIEGLTEAPSVMSILSFEPDAVVVRITAQCPVGENWRIERDIRTRVKARFDREGIVMPHYQKPPVSLA